MSSSSKGPIAKNNSFFVEEIARMDEDSEAIIQTRVEQ